MRALDGGSEYSGDSIAMRVFSMGYWHSKGAREVACVELHDGIEILDGKGTCRIDQKSSAFSVSSSLVDLRESQWRECGGVGIVGCTIMVQWPGHGWCQGVVDRVYAGRTGLDLFVHSPRRGPLPAP